MTRADKLWRSRCTRMLALLRPAVAHRSDLLRRARDNPRANLRALLPHDLHVDPDGQCCWAGCRHACGFDLLSTGVPTARGVQP